MEQLLKELKHLGLSEKESSVYLSALELGPASVQDVAHKSKVNRATTYVMIESLTSRGLMSTFVKGKKKFFVAESPERLKAIISMQQKELEEKLSELDETLPMLMALYNTEGAKPQIRYLEGFEGVKTARDIFEKLEGSFVEIYPYDSAVEGKALLDGRDDHHRNLREQGVKHRSIVTMNNPDSKKLPAMGVGEHRILSSDKFPMQGNVVVRNNHTFLFSHKSAILSVVIVSQEIADVMRTMFDLAWLGTKAAADESQS